MDTLFDLQEPVAFDRDRLRDRLHRLAVREVRIGGSSWKYEGWLDQIYSRSRYQSRGRFSRKIFEETCLRDYASFFPTACGDFAYYQFPPESLWAKLFSQTPETFRWGFKVPEQITASVWPVHPRYGALAGLANPTFLDARLFEQAFLRPLEPYRTNVGVLIFEFGAFARATFGSAVDFVKQLDPFLAALPDRWRYAVEIRTSDFLCALLFDCLRAHNVTHVYNSWTRMPTIAAQMAMSGSHTSDLIVVRALLKSGRTYEEAVRLFSPYDRVKEINNDVRGSLREIVDLALLDGRPAFIFVNNRLEGNSPGTIAAITSDEQQSD